MRGSVITRIVAYTCSAMAVLLFSNGLVVLKLEKNREEAFVADYQEHFNQSISDREQAEREFLRQNVEFNTEILSKIGAIHLYSIEKQEVEGILKSYINYPEILAITVLDDFGDPFAAIWKTPEIREGEALPEDLPLQSGLSIRKDAVYDGNNVGSVEVFYTEATLTHKIERMREQTTQDIATFQIASQARFIRTMLNQFIGGALILLALMLCQVVSLKVLIFKPLLTVSQIAYKLSHFDLTVELDTTRRDEIGKLCAAIKEMIRSFRNIVGQVQHSGMQVTSSATELAATAKQQDVTMKTQVESTHRVVKSVEEISTVASDLASTMQHVVSRSQETAELASRGQSDLAHMKAVMDNMEHASGSISGKLGTINEKAENITTVVTTINKVAEQTNLLSLNASIEAEKAGEYGRGFTVVAREIRRLADQTAVATLDIGCMVQEMQSAVAAGVMEMDKFIADVHHSVDDVEKISLQLSKIIDRVRALSPNFEEVNISMEQQSDHARQINQAITNLSEEMQQTRDSLHESYSAIEQLNDAARSLQNEVSRFKVTS